MHVVVVLAVVALPLIIGAVLLAVLSRRPDPAPSEAAAAARRHSATVNVLALTALFGTMIAGLTPVSVPPAGITRGVALGLIPAAAGIAFAAVQALGELTWPRPTGTLRRAPLTRRTAVDVAPRWLRRVTWSWAALTTVTLVACGAASDDGQGITLSYTALVGGAPVSGNSGAGPFPGWFYGVPLLIATVLVLAATEGVLRLIARRPAVMDAASEWDLELRRTSARRLLRGSQLVLGWTAVGVLFFAGSAMRRAGAGGSSVDGIPVGGSTAIIVAGTVMALVAGALWLVSSAVMFVPGRPAASNLTEMRHQDVRLS
ncbi:hypothetical protein [Pengzhenrongella phosphoraccumulans]|uniref:hypothetical protein n=1 Tax=Pengzhenrongella phosphoraccumulans TaxID=3114394 RepID=UPI00388E896F